jgi:hypothetical protein
MATEGKTEHHNVVKTLEGRTADHRFQVLALPGMVQIGTSAISTAQVEA